MKPTLRKILNESLAIGMSLVIAAAVCGIIIVALGENPFEILRVAVNSVLGSGAGIMYTLFYATPLIFTGLSVGIAFRGGLFNIGAEGQLYAGSFAAAWIGFTFTGLPGWLLVPLAVLAAALAGGIWGWIPGWLKGRFGSHEVINTIMMNYIAIGLISYLVTNIYRPAGSQIPQTVEIAPQAEITLMSDLFSVFGIQIPGSVLLNVSFFIAIAAALIIFYLLRNTVPGYEIRAVKSAPSAANSAGINTARTMAVTMALAGAAAGLVGVHEILGYRHRFMLGFSPGYGYTGIAIALLAKNHPIGIIATAILFGAIMRGGLMVDIYSDNISKDIIYVFQGVIILFAAARAFKMHVSIRRKSENNLNQEKSKTE